MRKLNFVFCLLAIMVLFIIPAYAGINEGLVGHWKLDEGSGSVVNDSAGIAGNGTVVGAPSWVAGKVAGGKALYFDSDGDYVTVPYKSSFYSMSSATLVQAFTATAWIKTEDFGEIMNKRAIIAHGSGVSPSAGWNFSFEPSHFTGARGHTYDTYSGHMHADYRDTASTYQYMASTMLELPQGNNWHHVAFVYDAPNAVAKIYVDGVLIDKDTTIKNGIFIDPTQVLSIGSLPSNAINGTFHGAIDDVRLYNRALSDTDIDELYRAHASNGQGDITPPSISISSPIKNQKIAGTVKIVANASDIGTGVAGVKFKIDGFDIGEEIVQPDQVGVYSTTLDTSYLNNGSHTLSAHVRDADGNVTAAPWVGVTVNNVLSVNLPVISDIQVKYITHSSAIVTWMTDLPSTTLVEYWEGATYFATPANNINVLEHTVLLTGLKANTNYRLKIRSGNQAGTTIAPDFNFSTNSNISVNKTYQIRSVDGDFMTIQACANVVRPGDTCLVNPGTYKEHVRVNASGTEDQNITFKANGPGVIMEGFDLYGSYIIVDGFEITNYDGQGPALILIGMNASYNKIINNYLHGARFAGGVATLRADGRVTSSEIDFLAAGFYPGLVLSSIGRENDTDPIAIFGNKTIAHVDQHTLILRETPLSGGAQTHTGYVTFLISKYGILFQNSYSRGFSPSYCEIRNNKIEGLLGVFISLSGHHHVIDRNELFQSNGMDLFRVFGHDTVISNNYVHEGGLPKGVSNHSDIFQTFSDSGDEAYNFLIENNFFSNLTTQLGQFNSGGVTNTLNKNFKNFVFRNNVFANITHNWSLDVPQVKFYNNTFYRVATQASGLVFGGSLTRGSPDGSVLLNNAFIDSGLPPDTYGTNGFYSLGKMAVTTESINAYVTKIDLNQREYAKPIIDDLIATGYLNVGYEVQPTFTLLKGHSELKLGAELVNSLMSNLGNNPIFYQQAIYRLLKQLNTYVQPLTNQDIADFLTHGLPTDQIVLDIRNDLFANGFIDSNGNVLWEKFKTVKINSSTGNVSDSILSAPMINVLKTKLGTDPYYFHKAIYNTIKMTSDLDLAGKDGIVHDYNMVANGDKMGFSAKKTFNEPHGINGKDPVFQNFMNLLGKDNSRFNEDDGLVPLANSPMCYGGVALDQNNKPIMTKDAKGEDVAVPYHIGAYPCKGCSDSKPIAYFTIDKNNDYEPLIVNFDANKSQSCANSLNYQWNFGDGTTATGPNVSHQFKAGTYNVILTITNDAHQTANYSKSIVTFPALVPNLVFYLPLDGHITDLSNRMDSEGKKNLGQWQGTPNYAPSQNNFAQAMYLANNASPYASFVHNNVLDGMDALTISVRAKKNDPNASGVLVGKEGVYKIGVGAKSMFGSVANSNWQGASFDKPANNNDTQWHHYAIVYDGTIVKWYLDGVLLPCTLPDCTPRTLTGQVLRSSSALNIGMDYSKQKATFSGLIDEVQIYNRALNAVEILALATTTKALGDTSSGNDPINQPPVASAQSISINQAENKTITLTASDPEGSTLSYSIVTPPKHGALMTTRIAADFIYTPDPAYSGSDNFTFKVNDGSLDSNIATVTLTISPKSGSGDVSGDSKITMYDAALALRYSFGSALSDTQKQKADMNADGKIDGSDVVAIGRKALGL